MSIREHVPVHILDISYSCSLTSGNMPKGQRLKLEEHMWFIGKLLILRVQSEDLRKAAENRMCRYLIATCHDKMYRRFNNATFSKPIRLALEKELPVDFTATRPKERPSADKLRNDRELLTSFILVEGQQVRVFKSDLAIPCIIGKAMLAASDPNSTIYLYDNSTARELNLFLAHLLLIYGCAISAVQEFRDPTKDKPKTDYTSLEDALTDAVDYGWALLKLRKGAALQQYLHDAEPFLSTYIQDQTPRPPADADTLADADTPADNNPPVDDDDTPFKSDDDLSTDDDMLSERRHVVRR